MPTVLELKAELRAKGLKLGGKKDEMIARLEDANNHKCEKTLVMYTVEEPKKELRSRGFKVECTKDIVSRVDESVLATSVKKSNVKTSSVKIGSLFEGYIIDGQLGKSGAQGTTYHVTKPGNPEKLMAMKTFKKTKSSVKIQKEGDLQNIAYKNNLAPRIYEINPEKKFIVMDIMDGTVKDYLTKLGGRLTLEDQKEILKICNSLDKIGLYHNDPNPLNLMYKEVRGKIEWKVIDFGYSRMMKRGDNPNANTLAVRRMFFEGMQNLGSLFVVYPDYLEHHTKV
jgi:serine/threonine protein kinase